MSLSVSFHGTPATTVDTYVYDDNPPILVLFEADANLSVSAGRHESTGDLLDFARLLAEAAAKYLTATEEYIASHPDPAPEAAPSPTL